MDNNPILKKQLSIKYAGSMERYEHFRRTMGASPLLYSHDFLFYNDDIIARHSRNIKELSLLKSLLREDKIEPSMLSFNVINTYYPSYILHHHYDVFIPLLANFASNKDVK
jgi:prephenate dehydrogenase